MKAILNIPSLRFAAAVLACPLWSFAAPHAPDHLLTSGMTDPLALERDSIQFTWQLPETRRGAAQSAYQVLVASTQEGLAANKGDCWDSGKIQSSRSASVAYGGKPLGPDARCWWRVRYWDEQGQESPYSKLARFDTGLNKGEWTAQYVWDGTTNVNNFAYFRKVFSVTGPPALAKIYASAHNDYLLFLNGKLLGRGPARSDPFVYGQYNAYDITSALKKGSNVLAAIAHWHGVWRDSGVNAEPGFLLETRFHFPDGSSKTLGTDASWKVLATTGYIETNAVYFGGAGGAKNRPAIQFDQRLEPDHWQELGYDDTSWAAATPVNCSSNVLFAQRVAQDAEHFELKPVRVTQVKGAWLVDFGRCLDGWPKLTLRANHPGDRIRVDYFQLPGEAGGSGWDEYTCRTGNETWKPNVGRHASFETLKITGYAGTLRASDVRAVWAYTGADVAGRFHCSSQLLNDIYEMCERSARQNVQQGIISVDANREQSPWTADTWNVGNVLIYNHRNTLMIDKAVRDYAAEQLPTGDFYACSPAAIFHSTEWSMYWPMLLWQQYLFSGDEHLLREMAPRLSSFLGWVKQYVDPKTHLPNPPSGPLIKTMRISDYAGGNHPNGGLNAATSCQYYENLRIAGEVFAHLGGEQEARQYRQEAEAVKAAINTHLFNGEYYLARTDKTEMFPLASAWPLRFDLVPADNKARVLESIRRHGAPVLGGYGGDAFYSGLLQAGGMGDYVVRDLERYRTMLKGNGANWESFGNRGEYNHAWTAYPGYIFQKHISGIQPTDGGFSAFEVHPEIGGLDFAESTVPTVKGPIQTRWEKFSGNRLSISLTVPANSRATLIVPLPIGQISKIEESGVVLWPLGKPGSVTGIESIDQKDGKLRCALRAGRYEFKIQETQAENRH